MFSRRFESDPPGGPAVVLLHGFRSDGERDWVATGIVPALLALGRTVIVPDLPGHGSSPPPATAAEARADRLAAAVLELAEFFDLVGYSLGARIAWAVAERAPERVGKVVLGGLCPVEPFAELDSATLGMLTGGDQGLERCVAGLLETPFTPRGWPGKEPPVFVVGQDDGMTLGIERIVESAELVRVPGGHAEALASTGFRDTIVRVM